MQLKFFCPRWGCEHIDWSHFMVMVKNAGYDGIEYSIARNVSVKELDEVWNVADKHSLLIIPQHYDTYDADFNQHLDLYTAWLEKLSVYPCEKIDSQTGKDFFSFEQNAKLVDVARQYSNTTGLKIYHETHRNKFLFAAHIAKDYLTAIPDLQITLDASHWVNVAESYLDDQPEAMELAIVRTGHIHARVGYPQGPQVSDPRAPEWQEALEKHLTWWDNVIALKKNEKAFTITPEFGAFPYLPHFPYTQQPIVSQWDINVFMMQLLRKRYA